MPYGTEPLQAATLGDPRVRIAILDGPVDWTHPSLVAANKFNYPGPSWTVSGRAAAHGTHVASVILGQQDGGVPGIAPQVSACSIPIFFDTENGSCSQIDLAHAITLAIEQNVHIINISGGQISAYGEPGLLLTNVIEECARRNILIIAAAGNDGCNCLHIPAAVSSVLAVGAMDNAGVPLPESNWGATYKQNGILAPGENIVGAVPGGTTVERTGTSFATAVVTGIASLLVSLQLKATSSYRSPLSLWDAADKGVVNVLESAFTLAIWVKAD
ncbi:S8 family serine peptidase, partial [Paraburkholderia aspalathi]|uniref:S8 family serine peptidase n=1 Tax=Paraburkholderia aspalathi TaxID=1324617 RepID=UPI001BA688FF